MKREGVIYGQLGDAFPFHFDGTGRTAAADDDDQKEESRGVEEDRQSS